MKLLNTPWRNGTVEGKLLNNTNKLSRSAYNIDFTSWIDSKLCSKNNRRPVNLSVNTWTVVVYCIIIHSTILVVTFPVFCSTLWNSQNHKHFNIFLYFYLFISNHKHLNIFLSLFLYQAQKLTISPIFIYKHYAINIADPSSMQDACHVNLLIDLAHCGVCGLVVDGASECGIWRSEVSHGDSSWRLRIFSLSHACEKTKNIFLYLKYMLGTDHAEYKDT